MWKIKNRLSLLLCALMILSFLNCSKDNDNPTGPGPSTPITASNLEGKWAVQHTSGDIYIVVDSTQTSHDILGEGSGGIMVTGACSVTLKYLISVINVGLTARNVPLYDNDTYPRYKLKVVNLGPLSSVGFVAYRSGTDSTVFNTTTLHFNYDTTAHTLTINPPMVLGSAASESVTIQGSLTIKSTTMNAGSKTKATTLIDMVDTTSAIIFKADSSYCVVDSIDTTEWGIWQIANNELTLMENIPSPETTDFSASLSGTVLTAIAEEKEYCHATNQANCYGQLEPFLGLATGSIDTATIITTYTLQKK